VTTPADAVRAELRTCLEDLAEALLRRPVPMRDVANGLIAANALCRLAEREGDPMTEVLRDLRIDFEKGWIPDPRHWAERLTLAAERLSD
jgi:hypothetical protein